MFGRCSTVLALSLALAAAGLVPQSQVQAQPGSVMAPMLLRYQFAEGETATYRVALGVIEGDTHVSSGNTTSNNGSLLHTGFGLSGTSVLDERVLTVDPHGVAAIQVHVKPLVLAASVGNYTLSMSRTVPESLQIVIVSADGATRASAGADNLGVAYPALGDLPPAAIAPGTRWTSHVAGTLPQIGIINPALLPTIMLTVENAFTGTARWHSQTVAVIESTAHLHYKGATTQGTETVTLRASGPVTMQSFFDLTSGQIVKTTIHEDLNVSDQYAYNSQSSRGYAAHLLVSLTETKM